MPEIEILTSVKPGMKCQRCDMGTTRRRMSRLQLAESVKVTAA